MRKNSTLSKISIVWCFFQVAKSPFVTIYVQFHDKTSLFKKSIFVFYPKILE